MSTGSTPVASVEVSLLTSVLLMLISLCWCGGGLADFDEVTVRVADVAADLGLALYRRRQELGAAGAPLRVDRIDVGHADVQEAAGPSRVGRRLERDGRLVVGRPAADVDDDPAVG